MARTSKSGKGKGGFASAKTRRARKTAALIKSANRARNAAAKAQ
jgi:hypothetical protein